MSAGPLRTIAGRSQRHTQEGQEHGRTIPYRKTGDRPWDSYQMA
jgi:hypothetical protein